MKNEGLKLKFLNKSDYDNNKTYKTLKEFYYSVYKTESDLKFWEDFNKYLSFQMDLKQKKVTDFKLEDFTQKLAKAWSGSTVNYFKLYTRSVCVIITYYNKVSRLIWIIQKLFIIYVMCFLLSIIS